MKHQRSRVFVDRAFQGRLLLRLICYWAIYHVALWHLLFVFSIFFHTVNHDPAAPAKSLQLLYREFAANHVSIVVCFIVMLPILGRDLLKFSHRLAGPLVRFRNVMKEMAEGKAVEEITLRHYDLPGDFLATFNNMVRKWNTMVADSRNNPSAGTELELVESKS